MTKALIISSLEVQFKRFALGPIGLALDPGRVVGLVGPNGSGKTTTIRCVAGNLRYDTGGVEVYGRAAAPQSGEWKQDIGYVPDKPVFYGGMTAGGFLRFVSRFYRGWSASFASKLSDRFRLDLEEKVGRMSMGNLVKLALVAALGHKPRLALFDEPTAGLDPIVRTEVFDVLGQMMESQEMTIVYSTHIMDDLHRLADELVFLRDGTIHMHEAKDTLVDRWRWIRCRHEGRLDDAAAVLRHDRQGPVHELLSTDGDTTIAALRERGAEVLRVQPLPLEEIAVHIMKGEQ